MRRLFVLMFAACLAVAHPAAAQLRPMLPWEIAARVNWTPQCSNYAIVGFCTCNGIPCAWRVAHYVPVAFIETVRRSGETMVATLDFSSIVAAMGSTLPGLVRQINHDGMDNTFEAHNFSMPWRYLQISTLCMTCSPENAKTPYIGTSSLIGNWGGGACGVLNNVTSWLSKFSQIGGALGAGYTMEMYYASETDFLHWRTGCRDVSLTNMLQSNAFTCGLNGVATLGGRVNSPLGSLIGADACIGSWGPLYPRQMRTRGPTQVLASAVAAYRSMSVARTDTLTFPFPVGTDGKMQQAYPLVSFCGKVGATPLPLTTHPSPDGAMGWIYWRPVSCCIPFSVVDNCFR